MESLEDVLSSVQPIRAGRAPAYLVSVLKLHTAEFFHDRVSNPSVRILVLVFRDHVLVNPVSSIAIGILLLILFLSMPLASFC